MGEKFRAYVNIEGCKFMMLGRVVELAVLVHDVVKVRVYLNIFISWGGAST